MPPLIARNLFGFKLIITVLKFHSISLLKILCWDLKSLDSVKHCCQKLNPCSQAHHFANNWRTHQCRRRNRQLPRFPRCGNTLAATVSLWYVLRVRIWSNCQSINKTPLKINILNPQKWKFDKMKLPFQAGDFQLPAVNFPGFLLGVQRCHGNIWLPFPGTAMSLMNPRSWHVFLFNGIILYSNGFIWHGTALKWYIRCSNKYQPNNSDSIKDSIWFSVFFMTFRLVLPFADRISSSDCFANPTPDFLSSRCQRNPTCSILMSVTPAILPMARVDLGETHEAFCEASQTSVDLTISLHFFLSLETNFFFIYAHLYEHNMNIWMHERHEHSKHARSKHVKELRYHKSSHSLTKTRLIHHQWQKSWLMANGYGKQLCRLRDVWDDIMPVFRPLKPFNIGSQAHQYQQLRPPVATKDHP